LLTSKPLISFWVSIVWVIAC